MNFFFFTLFKNYRNWRYSIITNAMNAPCPKDLFKNEFLFILFKNYRNWEFLSTFYDAIHWETTYTANLQFQNSARVPVYDC